MTFKMRTLRVNEDSKLAQLFRVYPTIYSSYDAANADLFAGLEAAIAETNAMGRLPLWSDYKSVPNYGRRIENDPKRKMNDVRTKAEFCRFYAWLAETMAPDAIVEFGAAFAHSCATSVGKASPQKMLCRRPGNAPGTRSSCKRIW